MAADEVQYLDDQIKGEIETNSEETAKFTQSSTSKKMAINLSNVKVQDWFQRQRNSIKPWSEFLNSKKFRPPKSVAIGGKRIISNITNFQSNYLFVFLGLLIFCLLTSPILLIAMGACLGACYIINLKNADRNIVVMGKEISLVQQYAAVGVLSFPLFWIAGAGSAVFWVIGASLFCILLHASMFSGGDGEQDPFELEMESV